MDTDQVTESGQAQPAANPPASSAPAGGGAAPGNAAPPVQGAPSSGGASAPMPQTTSADTGDQLREPNWSSRIYHGVLAALGGTSDVTLSRDPTTGKMVASKATSGTGTQWKRIIAGALTGAAGAEEHAGTGPGQKARALGSGFAAEQQQIDKNKQEARSNANEDFEYEKQAAYEKAQTALLNHQISASAFDLQRAQIKAQFDDAKRENELADAVKDGGQGSQDLGVAPTFQDAIAMHKDMPDLVNQQAHGNIIGVPHINANGVIDGMHYALVTPEWKSAKLTEDSPFYKLKPPTKPGEQPTAEEFTIPAGSMTNGDYWKFKMAADKEFLDYYKDQQKQKDEEEKNRALENQANSEANKNNAEAAVIERSGALPSAATSRAEQEEQEYGPGGEKGFNQWHQQMVVPAEQTEISYKLASNAYNDYQAAKAKGQDLPTGAQSMQLLSQHIATTFGSVKGARITKDMIQQHLGARSVSDDLQVAVQKLYDGDALSAKQWDAFGQLISQKRNEGWNEVLQDAVAEGRPLDRIAFPADFRAAKGLGPGRTLPGGPGQQPTNGQQPAQNAQQPPAANAGQSWSLAAWQRANPKGDANAAKAAAAAAGYKVVP